MVGVYTSLDSGYSFARASYLPLVGTGVESDPALAFDSQGRAYASYVSYDADDGGVGGVAVVRSDDGGLSWPNVASLAAHNEMGPSGCVFTDFPSIVTHRHALPGGPPVDHIYVAWTAIASRPCGNEVPSANQIMLARSDDGGSTWLPLGALPKLVGESPDSPVVNVAADGTLLVGYSVVTGRKTDCVGTGLVDHLGLREHRPDKMMVASSSGSFST